MVAALVRSAPGRTVSLFRRLQVSRALSDVSTGESKGNEKKESSVGEVKKVKPPKGNAGIGKEEGKKVKAAKGNVGIENKESSVGEVEVKVKAAKGDVGIESKESVGEVKKVKSEPPGGWKWLIRKHVWDLFILPKHRFPNFEETRQAAEKLWRLPEYRSATCVYVSTDTPQRHVRVMLLKNMKKMLVSRLPKALFSLLDPMDMTETQIKEASQQAEFRIEGRPIGLNDNVNVDLIVIGSVAVDPKNGARLGKGDGYAEYEYAMLRYIGAVDDSTLVVTTVHDDQLVENIPAKDLLKYDLPVDVICTPTQVIRTKTTIPKPKEILWDQIFSEKLSHFAFLRELKSKTEKKAGNKVRMAGFKKLQMVEKFHGIPAIFITEINPSTTSEELTDHLTKLGVTDVRAKVYKTDSRKTCGRVLPASKTVDIEKLVEKINNTKLKGWSIKARRDRHVREETAVARVDTNKLARLEVFDDVH